MLYGLENYILFPPYSVLSGIFLFLGITFLGNLLLKNLKNLKDIFGGKYFYLHSSLVGINSIFLVLYILIILNIFNLLILRVIGIFLISLGLYSIFKVNYFIKLKKIIKDIYIKKSYLGLTIIIFIALYFLLSIYPLSHADALNYHSYAAINFINFGRLPSSSFNEALVLSGMGELLISLGLSLGSQHFSNIIQFAGILSLFAIFFKNDNKDVTFRNLLFLGILTSPVIIFFLTSSKPQFLLIINTLVVFAYLLEKKEKEKENTLTILILFTLVSINFLSKFSFILSGSIIGVLIFYKFFNKISFWKILISGAFVFLILILPYMINRFINFDTNYFLQLTSHLPVNLEYYKLFNEYVISQSDGSRLFPFFLLIPIHPSVYTLTIGCGLLILIFLNLRKNRVFIFSAFLILLFYLFYGPNVSRFVFEPLVLIIYLILLNHSDYKIGKKIYSFCLTIQSVCSLLVIIFSLSMSIPALFNSKSMNKFMNNYAYEYQIMNWVNQNIDNNLSLISFPRSIGLLNNKSLHFSFEFRFIKKGNKIENNLIKNFFEKEKFNYILTKKSKSNFKHPNCLGKLIKKSDVAFAEVSRNPFNKDKNTYHGYVYKFNVDKFPGCLNN